jgi:hypothetical protein
LELKFFILNEFLDLFEYTQVDRLLTIFEKHLIRCDID